MAAANNASPLVTSKTLAIEEVQQRYIDALEKRISVLELQLEHALPNGVAPVPDPKPSTESPTSLVSESSVVASPLMDAEF